MDDIKLLKIETNAYQTKMSQKCFQLPPNKDFNFFKQNKCLETNAVNPNRPIIMLIGDSHSASLSLGMRSWAEDQKISFYQISSGACSLFSDDQSDDLCQTYTRETFDTVREIKPDLLIIDMYWYHASEPVFYKNTNKHETFIQYLEDKFKTIAGMGAKKVIIVGQIPTWRRDLPDVLLKNFIERNIDIPELSDVEIDQNSLDMDFKMKSMIMPSAFDYVSLYDLLCDQGKCRIKIGPDISHDLIVWDYGHLTLSGANYVMKNKLAQIIDSAMAQVTKH